jgi:hypothetical protein
MKTSYCQSIIDNIPDCKNVNIVVIKHVDLWILTAADISCEEFDRNFSSDKEYDTIASMDDILCIYEYLNQFKEISRDYCDTFLSFYGDCMDTRAKMQIHTSSNMTEICISNGIALHHNCYYKTPIEFTYYLNDMLEPVIINIPKRKNRIR